MTAPAPALAPIAAPDAAAPLCRSVGVAAVGFTNRDGGTRIDSLHQSGCLRLRFPADRRDDAMVAVLLNTAGGLTGGDRLDCAVRLGAATAACVTTQAAEKVYRAVDGEARVAARLQVGAGALLEWLPQETILFDGGRLRRDTRVELGPGARLLAHESVVFGRRARGEEVRRGLLHDGWRVHRAGRLIWADTVRLGGDMARALDRRALGDGARAVATLLYAAANAPAWLGAARELLGRAGCRGAATAFDEVLVIRMVDREPHAVRRAAQTVLAGLRAVAEGLAPVLPRVWLC